MSHAEPMRQKDHAPRPIDIARLTFAPRLTISLAVRQLMAQSVMAHSVKLVRSYFLLAVAAALWGMTLWGMTPMSARAQAGFDGAWSILIVTESGECDRAYRYAVQIDHGHINYDGTAGVELTGNVDRNGRVSATVQRGGQGANGTGRLSGNRGRGTWQGKSSTGQCSGYWEAQRR